MPFDGCAIHSLVKELNTELIGQRIEKIYQPEKDEIVMVVRRKKGNSRLLISANPRWARMHITTERADNPPHPLAFCMLLRKYLEGGKILGFEQDDFERIVNIRIEALNDLLEWREKVLVCEFTGKNSNIVLIDPETSLIIDGIKRYGSDVSSHREVQPGLTYIAPPSQGKLSPLTASYEEFYRAFWVEHGSTNASHALFLTYTGLSPQTCQKICHISSISPDTAAEQCGEFELSRIYQQTRAIVEGTISQPTLVLERDIPTDYFPFNPPVGDSTTVQLFEMINDAMDHFYASKLANVRLESLRTNVLRNVKTHLDKAYKKLFFQESDFGEAEKNRILKTWGELLTSYAFNIKKGETLVSLPNFEGDGQTEIELVPYLSPIENAQKFFKKYARSRKTLERLEFFIEQNKQEIAYLESVAYSMEKAETIEEMEDIIVELEEEGYMKHKSGRGKQRQARSVPRRYVSSTGIDIWVGRNNKQNDQLTLKRAGKNDLWLH
ncbi:MAG: NFACT family protein, partial [Candidatus Saccharibacteria bacterium]